jgi:hypothetical protein
LNGVRRYAAERGLSLKGYKLMCVPLMCVCVPLMPEEEKRSTTKMHLTEKAGR